MSSVTKLIHTVCFAFFLTCNLSGQVGLTHSTSVGNSEKLPEFEVATVKPTNPKSSTVQGPVVYPGGRVVIRHASLKELIAIAFHLSYWQIARGDDWTDNSSWDVEAKAPENFSTQTHDLRYTNWAIEDKQLQQMLQALLIDRFELKLRREVRSGTVYFLERSGKQLRLEQTKAPSASGDGSESVGFSGDIGFAGGRWVLFNTSLPEIAKYASDHILRAPVSDKTGLSGSFDYSQKARLSDAEANYADPSGSFLLLIGELGLKLKSTRGEIQSFVIDRANRPSPN